MHDDGMPCVSQTTHFRSWFLGTLCLVKASFELLYGKSPLPWDNIFYMHRIALCLSGRFLMASVRKPHARIRSIAATTPGTLWPPSPSHLDASHVVYIAWSVWSPGFYIGKTVSFRERIRRDLYGLVRPESSPQQPYMRYLIGLFNGCAPAAAASLIFMPVAACASDEAALALEHALISREHPPFNEPYVQRLLSRSCPLHGFSRLLHV